MRLTLQVTYRLINGSQSAVSLEAGGCKRPTLLYAGKVNEDAETKRFLTD
jgi:hypothetical protein